MISTQNLRFFGAVHMKIGPPHGEARAKNVREKKSPPTGRNCENTAIYFAIRAK